MKRGALIVLSGPSGVGKGTVRGSLFANNPINLKYSISMTTRDARKGEVNGKDYFFVSKQEFEEKIKNGDMLEYAEYVGNYYGTPKFFIEKTLNEGNDVLLEIEVKGALQIKKQMPEAIFIFLTPPDLNSLKTRLINRGTESISLIEKRVKEAELEIRMMSEYDYAVVNKEVKHAVHQIEEIIDVERLKVNRKIHEYENIIGEL